jgi:hypothetical protein
MLGFGGAQSGNGAGSHRVRRFLLPILILQTAPHSPIIRSYTVSQEEWSVFWEVTVSVILSRKRV